MRQSPARTKTFRHHEIRRNRGRNLEAIRCRRIQRDGSGLRAPEYVYGPAGLAPQRAREMARRGDGAAGRWRGGEAGRRAAGRRGGARGGEVARGAMGITSAEGAGRAGLGDPDFG
jgi:hypothetical protein